MDATSQSLFCQFYTLTFTLSKRYFDRTSSADPSPLHSSRVVFELDSKLNKQQSASSFWYPDTLPVLAQTHHLHTGGSEKASCFNPDCKAFYSSVNDLLFLPPTHLINKQRESPHSAKWCILVCPNLPLCEETKEGGINRPPTHWRFHTQKRTVGVFLKSINRYLPTLMLHTGSCGFFSLFQLSSEHSPQLSECRHIETNNHISAYVQFRVT